MRRSVGVALHRDRRHMDLGTDRKPGFEFVEPFFTFRQAQPPAVVMNDDRDVIGIGKCFCTPIEGRVVELPLR